MRKTFERCVRSVKKTVRARKGSNKKSAAIAICTKSVLQKRGRTMKSFRKGRLITQRKLRRGGVPGVPGTGSKNAPVSRLQQVQQGFNAIQEKRTSAVRDAQKAMDTAAKSESAIADLEYNDAEKQLDKASKLAGLDKPRYAPASA